MGVYTNIVLLGFITMANSAALRKVKLIHGETLPDQDQLCRDRQDFLDRETFGRRSCTMCYTFLFQFEKELVPIRQTMDYLVAKNQTGFPVKGLIAPDISNDTSKGLICSTLNSDECERWTTCCQAAIRCCTRHLSMKKPTPEGFCPRTWDGFDCWEDLAAGQTETNQCPWYIPLATTSGRAYKQCTENGTWFKNMNREWTNYTECPKKQQFDDQDSCDLDYFAKKECGYPGISENECLANGCCYQEIHVANVPWCYRAYGSEATEPPPHPCVYNSTLTYPYDIHSTEDPLEEEFGLSPEELSAYDMAWVPASGGDVPDDAVYNADNPGQRYFIVRVKHDGAIYPGKLGSSYTKAFFAVPGEGELHSSEYEVLQQLPTSPLKLKWIKPVWSAQGPWIPMHILKKYAVVGGEVPSVNTYGPQKKQLFVVIGETPEGYHPGYIGPKDTHANIGWEGTVLEVGYNLPGPPDAMPDIGFALLLAIPIEALPSIMPPSPDYMQDAQIQP